MFLANVIANYYVYSVIRELKARMSRRNRVRMRYSQNQKSPTFVGDLVASS